MKRKNQAQSYFFVGFILFLLLLAGMDGIMLLVCLLSQSFERFLVTIIIINSLFGVLEIVLLVLYLHYRNAKLINIQKVKFYSYESSFLGRRGNFVALIANAVVNNQKVQIMTTRTFSSNTFSEHGVNQYLYQTRLVGYDPKWKKWVLITE